MDKSFFIREEVRVTLERDSEELRQNIVTSGRVLLGSLDVTVVVFPLDRLTDVWLGLRPHLGVADFFDLVGMSEWFALDTKLAAMEDH